MKMDEYGIGLVIEVNFTGPYLYKQTSGRLGLPVTSSMAGKSLVMFHVLVERITSQADNLQVVHLSLYLAIGP
jgi:hypothetical protein